MLKTKRASSSSTCECDTCAAGGHSHIVRTLDDHSGNLPSATPTHTCKRPIHTNTHTYPDVSTYALLPPSLALDGFGVDSASR